MPVYFIASISIPHSEDGSQQRGEYDAYIEQVKPVVENFGGKYLVRGNVSRHLAGEWQPDRVIVIEFPDAQSMTACFDSPEYRWIESMRTLSVHSSAVAVEE